MWRGQPLVCLSTPNFCVCREGRAAPTSNTPARKEKHKKRRDEEKNARTSEPTKRIPRDTQGRRQLGQSRVADHPCRAGAISGMLARWQKRWAQSLPFKIGVAACTSPGCGGPLGTRGPLKGQKQRLDVGKLKRVCTRQNEKNEKPEKRSRRNYWRRQDKAKSGILPCPLAWRAEK